MSKSINSKLFEKIRKNKNHYSLNNSIPKLTRWFDMAIPNLEKQSDIKHRSSEVCFFTARNWCTISPALLAACHRPGTMQVQQSPTNTMRCYDWCLVNDIDNHDDCSVPCARSQAFVVRVCPAGLSAPGRRATFNVGNTSFSRTHRAVEIYHLTVVSDLAGRNYLGKKWAVGICPTAFGIRRDGGRLNNEALLY